MVSLKISADDDGVRFDRVLRRHLRHMPLSEIFRLVRTGGARINGRRARGNVRLREGDTVELQVDAAEVADTHEPQGGNLDRLADTGFFKRNFRVVFEDEALLVCDKPPGLVVHPGSGHTKGDTLIECAQAYLRRTSANADVGPLLVHRLDRDTSGLILIARNRRALRALHRAMQAGDIDKRYLLLCHGQPKPATGSIDAALIRDYERNDGTKVRVTAEGMHSRTRYRTLRSGRHGSMVEASLDTGRTHQIRVHMRHLGCPILGDVRYGDKARDQRVFEHPEVENRLYLHAKTLRFPHPLSGERIVLDLPEPASFRTAFR
ncbi:MAG: RluA family pseudouridine synthase, partial [Chitinivibrionales bacterium]|nr:RluA family pseudouridine synthase [Chitinivibrionales bacterium]